MATIHVPEKGNLYKVLDTIEQVKDKLIEQKAAFDGRIKELEDRCNQLDRALPRGEKLFVPEGSRSRQAGVARFGQVFTAAFCKSRNTRLPESHEWVRTGQNETTASAGGVLVPKEVYPEIVRIIEERSIIRSIARVIPMTRDKMDVPTVANGPAISWAGTDGGTITDDVSEVTFGTGALDSETCSALDSVSRDLDEDAIIAIEPLLAEIFAEAIAKAENQQAFSSTTPFTGIVQTASIGSYSMPTGSTHFSTVSFSDLVATKFKVNPNVVSNGTWIMHPATFQYIVGLKDTQNRPIYATSWSGGFGDFTIPDSIKGLPSKLLGSDCYTTTTMPLTNAVNLAWAIYGDFNKFAFGDRRALTVEFDDSVYFQNRRRAILVSERVALKPLIASAFAVIKTAAS